MPNEAGKISDAVEAALFEGGTGQIVGNEQWADAEGISGPDPAEWDNPEAREDTGFVPGPRFEGANDTITKGPDPAQHPDREV